MHRNEDFMKRLMMYLKDYKKESILAPLFKLLEAFFELLVPLVMANIIDYGISNRNMGYIGKMGLLLLLLGVVQIVSAIILAKGAYRRHADTRQTEDSSDQKE